MNRLKSATLAVIHTALELYAPNGVARIPILNRLTTPHTSLMGCSVHPQPCQKCIDTLKGSDQLSVPYCRHALRVTKERATSTRVP